MSDKRPFVVIAHQSALPHYRVEFYNELARVCAGIWDFGVVYDRRQAEGRTGFSEALNPDDFQFRVLATETRTLTLGGKPIVWQNLGQHLHRARVLVTDSHVSNLAYPLYGALARPRGCRWVVWGHQSDRNKEISDRRGFFRITESAKKLLLRRSDGFFAYTAGERASLIKHGYPPDQITTLNNTIDVVGQRILALSLKSDREAIRSSLGFHTADRVFLVVGRLIAGRRVEFLLDTLRNLADRGRDDIKLVLVGSCENPDALRTKLPTEARYLGSITDKHKLGELYTVADCLIMPGMIGLGPLAALAHELPVIGFHLDTHGPEVEYLNEHNSVLLAGDWNPQNLADYLAGDIIAAMPRWDEKRYQSIAHLTIQAMAQRFHQGILNVLEKHKP